jgi:type VI secretion system protein VasD
MVTGVRPTRRSILARGLAITALLPLLAGCGGGKPPPPVIAELHITAAADINPDEAARAAPVMLKIFQLSSTGGFDAIDFYQLGDGAALGRDLVAQDELSIAPGDHRDVSQPLKDGAHYLAVVAAFRAIDRASWKSVVAVPPQGTTALNVEVSGTRVTIKAKSP